LRKGYRVANYGYWPLHSAAAWHLFGREELRHAVELATFDPEWRTSTVVGVAEQLYESRDFNAMPSLADALQDAVCANEDILNHCRDPQAIMFAGVGWWPSCSKRVSGGSHKQSGPNFPVRSRTHCVATWMSQVLAPKRAPTIPSEFRKNGVQRDWVVPFSET
jgi:hypothetical protein